MGFFGKIGNFFKGVARGVGNFVRGMPVIGNVAKGVGRVLGKIPIIKSVVKPFQEDKTQEHIAVVPNETTRVNLSQYSQQQTPPPRSFSEFGPPRLEYI